MRTRKTCPIDDPTAHTLVIEVIGEIDVHTAPLLREELESAIRSHDRIVLDLTRWTSSAPPASA
jgi:anti-anti-sigma regulatory factor